MTKPLSANAMRRKITGDLVAFIRLARTAQADERHHDFEAARKLISDTLDVIYDHVLIGEHVELIARHERTIATARDLVPEPGEWLSATVARRAAERAAMVARDLQEVERILSADPDELLDARAGRLAEARERRAERLAASEALSAVVVPDDASALADA